MMVSMKVIAAKVAREKQLIIVGGGGGVSIEKYHLR